MTNGTRDLLTIGGLSNPSKMPGRAFGFSPERCVTGTKLRAVAGSVCSDCYACKGCYQFRSVKLAHKRRYGRLQRALSNPVDRERWVSAMARLIGRQRVPYFRWHDSGDLQSADHLRMIADVCERTPHIRHWLPTREYRMVREYMVTDVLPKNLNVRLSAHMRNEKMPNVPFGLTASAVYDDRTSAPGYHCPAYAQGGKCGDCRACWDRECSLVVYPTH